jgi:hypothetical protein
MNRSLGSILFLIVVTVVGCSNEVRNYTHVKGKVTFNGTPIEKGQISFAAPGKSPTTMLIVDGAFDGQAAIGENIVSVSATKKSANAPKLPKNAEIQVRGYMEKFKRQPEQGGATSSDDVQGMVEYIPPEWGTKSKQVRMIEPGTNEIEIHIKGKN